MAKKASGRTGQRQRRDDPDRETPDRRASEHIRRNAGSQKGGRYSNHDSKPRISNSVEEAISGMVQQSSAFIEEQIRAGQQAAERLRDGLANSKQLNADINTLVENLVATTKDVGATWLDLISIIIRAIGTQQPHGGGGGGGTPHTPPGPGIMVTRSGTSGGATTLSSITPADNTIVGVPPRIVVKGAHVTSVVLDLRPPSLRFVPVVPQLMAADLRRSFSAQFALSSDSSSLVLTVTVPDGQPRGIYTGAIVDSRTNEAGGTLSVTVAG
jgi:hypothetical protein